MIYNLIIANWQLKTANEKKVFNDYVKDRNLNISGWNYFYQQSLKNLTSYLGLAGYWAFNRIVGGQALDLSGNDIHATLVPSYPANWASLKNGINRKFGKAGDFDGINNYATVAPFAKPSANYATFSCIVKIHSEHTSVIFDVRDESSGDSGFYFIIDAAKTRFIINNDAGGVATGSPLEVDKWYKIDSTYDSSLGSENVKIYYNGILEAVKDYTTPIVGTTFTPAIGSRYATHTHKFNGLIDDAQLYNRALILEEIQKLYALISPKL